MPVYARKLSPEWRKAFAEFESISGFEMMHQDDVDSGVMTPAEAWSRNQDWFFSVYCDVQNIPVPFTCGGPSDA